MTRKKRSSGIASTELRERESGEHPAGKLYLVATPIGNLGDMSARAVQTLRQADLILCEDTRNFHTLATRFGIEVPTRSLHDHNELQAVPQLVEELSTGKVMALVSDAGTPLISDPGYRLVRACVEAGIPLSPIPGPSACLAALIISGFEINRYCFAGFPPRKSAAANTFLKALLDLEMTFVLYESPFRVLKTMEQLAQLASDRDVCLARELTKIYEETVRGTSQHVFKQLSARASIKGECVIVVRGRSDLHYETHSEEEESSSEDRED